METILAREEDIIEEFSFFDDWMDKYTYLISLGKDLAKMIPESKTPENQIKGCQSQVWLNAKINENSIFFEADSDAIITRGMIALLLRVVQGQKPEEIAVYEFKFLQEIGLTAHLSPSRANGLLSMVKQIRLYGVAFQAKRK
ncbi:MAG: Cysteine desulfuration protein SufE [Owenweeksia sp. TMED14]|nr:MAG: Cysteine desulfuration protein SufE [Owenweeksia sp. TMED14]|tara:strand:- start:3095 stop:3520 length:426 start_codon:yes stop_codon:yes gene_type:complete